MCFLSVLILDVYSSTPHDDPARYQLLYTYRVCLYRPIPIEISNLVEHILIASIELNLLVTCTYHRSGIHMILK
jgi:hypothetical protein